MNLVKQKLVLKKLNSVQPEELVKYAKEIDETLTLQQAQKITALVHGKNINIFNTQERVALLKNVSMLTNPQVSRKLNDLFNEFLS